MVAGRPISELCRDLAASANRRRLNVLGLLLRMASLEAAKQDFTFDGAPFVFESNRGMGPSVVPNWPADQPGTAKRIGISAMFVTPFIEAEGNDVLRHVDIYADLCSSVASSFDAGRVDVAMVLDVKDNRRKLGAHIIDEMPVDFAWVSAKGFKLERGEPVPLAIWPADQFILDTLKAAGRNCRVVCTTSDQSSKLAAVESGACVAAVPRCAIRASMVEIGPEELPMIAAKTLLVGARDEAQGDYLAPIVSRVRSLALHS